MENPCLCLKTKPSISRYNSPLKKCPSLKLGCFWMTEMTMNRKYYREIRRRHLRIILKVKSIKTRQEKACRRMSLTHVLNRLHPFGGHACRKMGAAVRERFYRKTIFPREIVTLKCASLCFRGIGEKILGHRQLLFGNKKFHAVD